MSKIHAREGSMITLGDSFEKLVEEVKEIGPSNLPPISFALYEETLELLKALRSSIPNLSRNQLMGFDRLRRNLIQFEADMRDLRLKINEERKVG